MIGSVITLVVDNRPGFLFAKNVNQMNKSTFFMLLFTGWYAGIDAQVARPVTISGQIKTDKDSVRLVVMLARDPIVGYGEEIERIHVPVNANGKFSFTTPSISRLARLSILDGITGNSLFTREQQLIAPGDKIELLGNVHDQAEPYYFKARFSGKGAAKYECIQVLKTTNLRDLDSAKGIQNIIRIYDSLVNSRTKIIESFSARLTPEEHDLMQADMTGELKQAALRNICGYNFGSVHRPKSDASELAQKKKIFDEFMAHLNAALDHKEMNAHSVTYRQYLYQKARAEAVFANNGLKVSFAQLFKKLTQEYKGLLRDKLLGFLLLSSSESYMFFGGIDSDEHAKCLQEALTVIQSDAIKDRIKTSLVGQVKGSPAFNFTLPLDSSETKKVSLSDLKGKVVLLDLWSYQCTGCVLFSNTFHKKIYPVFQNNPEFVVVSIMLGESSKTAYMRRLRREGGAVYTFPEYINLFGGIGITSAREMETYHKIEAYPTILLIDKQGKIYSSTLPAIYGDPRNKELENNIKELTELIQKALSEPGVQKTIL
jgi:thiol-disulfide isomerase/thioredoxin